jgi:hypothetical protein
MVLKNQLQSKLLSYISGQIIIHKYCYDTQSKKINCLARDSEIKCFHFR